MLGHQQRHQGGAAPHVLLIQVLTIRAARHSNNPPLAALRLA
jgi:hypothetical protein